MNKSAEMLRVEAHGAICWLIVPENQWPSNPAIHEARGCLSNHFAIDLAIAARAAEVGEGMHEAGCRCDSMWIEPPDPRCTEARSRLHAEMERLTHAD